MSILAELKNRFRPVLSELSPQPDELLAMIVPAQDALDARELNRRLKDRVLVHCCGFHQAGIHQRRYDRRHAVIAQPAGVDASRHEGAAHLGN